jgi:thiol-disulfide isomerase/thioredoxin
MTGLSRRAIVSAASVLPLAALVAGRAAYAAPAGSLSAPLASVLGAKQWLNTPRLRPEDVQGKVVLVNVWTYSCIYCLRTLPFLRAWAAKYKDQGLVVIGVHLPEFRFERDPENVRTALGFLGVGYPIAIDSDHGIWQALENNAWPTFYFIDAVGRIREHLEGEGSYEESERLIQALLSEADRPPQSKDTVTVKADGVEAAPDIEDVHSPETYVGYAEGENFASPGGVRKDTPTLYRTGSALSRNQWGLTGLWTIGSEFATPDQVPASASYRFHARDLHLILTPSSPDHAIRFRVTLDGAPPGDSHGSDVDAQGLGTVQDARLYQLVRQAGPIVDRTFRIEFFDPGVRAYDFTFG